VSTFQAFRPKLGFTPRRGGGHMVARRRSGHGAVLSLMVLLASTPRTEQPNPYQAGVDPQTGPSKKCKCGGVIVYAPDGAYCLDCGDPPPDTE